MCGRYYIDEGMTPEIFRALGIAETKLKFRTGEVHPSEMAPVIRNLEGTAVVEEMKWGFPATQGRGLLINARAETAMERRSFQESVLHRRCVVPARGFWEWNKSKEKFSFERADSSVMFMAGCYNCFQGQDRFVILTTEANASVCPVHDRMPLILEKSEIGDWVIDDRVTEYLLHKTPILLEREAEYEQMSLF